MHDVSLFIIGSLVAISSGLVGVIYYRIEKELDSQQAILLRVASQVAVLEGKVDSLPSKLYTELSQDSSQLRTALQQLRERVESRRP